MGSKTVLALVLALAGVGFAAEEGGKKAAGVKAYPLDTCIVSGEKLGEMGEPVVLVHEGQEVKFCCDSCQPKFEKDPAKYLKKMEAKAAKGKKGPATRPAGDAHKAQKGQKDDHKAHKH